MKIIFAITLIILAALGGYYFGYDIGFEKAIEENSSMMSDELAVIADDVPYLSGVTGYFAEPQEEGDYPGVVMIHEWWGLNDNIKEMAEELAAEGYVVLAVDLFGTVATTSEGARAQIAALKEEEALANLRAAASFLRERGADKVASLGWCFGGGQSLRLSLSDEPLDATIIYYGSLVTDEVQLANIDAPVLGIFGEEDQSIASSTVRDFESTLNRLSIQNDVTIYDGVGHAFANPSNPNYAPTETKDAWAKTLTFLETNLK